MKKRIRMITVSALSLGMLTCSGEVLEGPQGPRGLTGPEGPAGAMGAMGSKGDSGDLFVPHAPEIGTTDGRVTITSATTAGAGGSISVAAGQTAYMLGRKLSLPAYQSPMLELSAVYHLRYRYDSAGNRFNWVMDKVPYQLPSVPIGSPPMAAADPYYDSRFDDMLVAQVTGAAVANQQPVVQPLTNRVNLVVRLVGTFKGIFDSQENYQMEINQDVGWARTPVHSWTFAGQTRDDVTVLQGTQVNTNTVDRNRAFLNVSLHTNNGQAVNSSAVLEMVLIGR